MPFKLEDVNPATDFDELIVCEWESYEEPHQSFFRLFCPILPPHSRDEAIKESTARQLEWHHSDPTSFWQKITDEETGRIVAGALWKICTSNPFEHEESHEAYWFPEGGQRDFVTKALEDFDAPRMKMAPTPQLYLNIIFTHPQYRRRGLGDLVMEWGIKKADELGLDTWLDATIYGVPLYEKHGFVVRNENNIQPKTESPSDEWKKLETELSPMVMWQMSRPAKNQPVDTK